MDNTQWTNISMDNELELPFVNREDSVLTIALAMFANYLYQAYGLGPKPRWVVVETAPGKCVVMEAREPSEKSILLTGFLGIGKSRFLREWILILLSNPVVCFCLLTSSTVLFILNDYLRVQVCQ